MFNNKAQAYLKINKLLKDSVYDCTIQPEGSEHFESKMGDLSHSLTIKIVTS